jgi:hypothetical protein
MYSYFLKLHWVTAQVYFFFTLQHCKTAIHLFSKSSLVNAFKILVVFRSVVFTLLSSVFVKVCNLNNCLTITNLCFAFY